MATAQPENDIQLTDELRQQIAAIAKASGKPWQELLSEFIALHQQNPNGNEFSAREFDQELEPLLHSGPSLPRDFSRADIYSDHD